MFIERVPSLSLSSLQVYLSNLKQLLSKNFILPVQRKFHNTLSNLNSGESLKVRKSYTYVHRTG